MTRAHSRISTLVLGITLGFSTAAQDPMALQPGFLPYSIGPERWLVIQTRNDLSGQPIPTAVLDCIDERVGQVPEETWSMRRAPADESGVVRMRLDDLPGGAEKCWFVLSAPGYESRARLNLIGMRCDWALAPAAEWKVRFLTWDGRPVSRARVGGTLGCGHTPDLEHHVTSELGEATWKCIGPASGDPELYVVQDDVRIGPYSATMVGEEYLVICEPSRTVEGRLVESAKQGSWEGCRVGTLAAHRGPWTRVEADGAFRLTGAPLGCSLVLRRPGSADLIPVSGTNGGEWRESRDPRPLDSVAGNTRSVPFSIRGGPPAPPVLVYYDGRGRHEIDWANGNCRISVAGAGVLLVHHASVSRICVVSGVEDRIVLDWPPPGRLKARIVDGNGDVIDGSCRVERLSGTGPEGEVRVERGELELPCPWEESVLLAIRNDDGREDLLFVEHVARGEDLHLGSVRLDARTRLCSEGQKPGDELTGANLVTVGWKRRGVTGPDGELCLASVMAGPAWKSALLKQGDWIVYRAPGGKGVVCAERRIRVSADGVAPSVGAAGVCKIRIVDERSHETPGIYSVLVEGMHSWVNGREISVSVPGGGEVSVILCAEDGRSVRRVLRVQEGATAEFEFVLP